MAHAWPLYYDSCLTLFKNKIKQELEKVSITFLGKVNPTQGQTYYKYNTIIISNV